MMKTNVDIYCIKDKEKENIIKKYNEHANLQLILWQRQKNGFNVNKMMDKKVI